jgi:hypothetical protein
VPWSDYSDRELHCKLKFSSFDTSSTCCGANPQSGQSSATWIASSLPGSITWAPTVLDALKVLQPETLIRWHRAGFREPPRHGACRGGYKFSTRIKLNMAIFISPIQP